MVGVCASSAIGGRNAGCPQLVMLAFVAVVDSERLRLLFLAMLVIFALDYVSTDVAGDAQAGAGPIFLQMYLAAASLLAGGLIAGVQRKKAGDPEE